jgi:hypothetical protein
MMDNASALPTCPTATATREDWLLKMGQNHPHDFTKRLKSFSSYSARRHADQPLPDAHRRGRLSQRSSPIGRVMPVAHPSARVKLDCDENQQRAVAEVLALGDNAFQAKHVMIDRAHHDGVQRVGAASGVLERGRRDLSDAAGLEVAGLSGSVSPDADCAPS